MESVYPPSEFECSEHIDWKQHFEKFNESAGLSSVPLLKPTTKKSKLDILARTVDLELDYDQLKKIDDNCSLKHLDVEGEVAILPPNTRTTRKDLLKKMYLEKAEPVTELQTVKAKLNWMHTTDLGKRRKFFTDSLTPKKSSGFLDLYPGKDILITARIYQPFPYVYFKENKNFSDKIRCSHEIVFLGSQTLQQLKDKIVCENEKCSYSDIKDVADIKIIKQKRVKDEYPSSFIFIDEVFYRDLRHPKATDTSEVLREWAKTKKIGNFTTGDMAKTKFSDLKFRIGYPYVYQHIADCEHIIIFCDVRLLTKSDPLMSQDYPYISSIHRSNKMNCGICDQTVAAFLVLNSDRLPNARMFLCEQCFKSYNFIDGEKVGSFNAYPYFDRLTVL